MTVPSAETTVYFGDLSQRYPESGILAILFAELIADWTTEGSSIPAADRFSGQVVDRSGFVVGSSWRMRVNRSWDYHR
jgi:hypothetical protein